MDPQSREQRRRNRQSRDSWERYASHRQCLMQLLVPAETRRSFKSEAAADAPAGRSGGTLAVFGAGNGNDLDLQRLLRAFERVHLIDLDAQALHHAVAAQHVQHNKRVRLWPGVDVTGLLRSVAEWTPQQAPTVSELAAVRQALAHRPALDGLPASDVTASTGLLTQLVEGLVHTLGDAHPALAELIQALRRQHLRLLLEHTRPGGRVIVTLEVLSNETFPDLLRLSAEQLAQALMAEVQRGNFFTGVNPAAVLHQLRTDGQLTSLCADVQITRPWRWDFAVRTYAVVALVLRRAAEIRL